MYLGSFIIDDTCTLYCNAHTPSTGAAVDADAVPGYRVYEDETGTPILTGSFALLDDANTTGFYSEQLTLSAANGFEAGKSYSVRTTIVVGGVTGVQIDRLQIGARVDARLIAGQVITAAAGVTFPSSVASPTNITAGVITTVTNLTNAATAGDFTAAMKAATLARVTLVDTVTTYTGNTPQTGDVFPLASTEIADIKAKTDNLPTDPADESLIIAATDAIMSRLGAPAGASMSADIAAIEAQTDDIGVAGSGLTALGDTRIANLDATVSSRLSTAGYTAPPTVDAIADQVWDEAMADHLSAGSTGASLNGAGSAGDPWTTALPGAYGAGTAGKLVGDNLNATMSSRASQVSVDDLPTNAELTTALGTADDAVLTQVALVKAKTDNLPTDPADASVIAGRLDTLDTSIADLPTNGELATALGTADDAVLAAIAALNNLSQANVRTAVGLASANLDTQLADLPTNAELATALSAADDAVLAAIAALNNLSAAQVNAEVVDALNVDTYAQPGQGTPPATASVRLMQAYLYKAWRNATTQTATQYSLMNDDAVTVDQKATFSDDGTTATRGEQVTGP